ncbi:hypothetical protein K438DRAFT_1766224 [Mycena galopus ATCC 62051]|nr:hypothetical protein K438DRAFT_1766224 [Mycena galopus ATCC 62051]
MDATPSLDTVRLRAKSLDSDPRCARMEIEKGNVPPSAMDLVQGGARLHFLELAVYEDFIAGLFDLPRGSFAFLRRLRINERLDHNDPSEWLISHPENTNSGVPISQIAPQLSFFVLELDPCYLCTRLLDPFQLGLKFAQLSTLPILMPTPHEKLCDASAADSPREMHIAYRSECRLGAVAL